MSLRNIVAAAFVISATVLSPAGLPVARGADVVPAAVKGPAYRVVFQVSDSDPKRWSLALGNIRNVQDEIGASNVAIELVAYGPGIGMLRFDSEVADRVGEAIDRGVRVVACENTMKAIKLTKDDMLPRLDYVKAGVVEIVARQGQGYQYVRP